MGCSSCCLCRCPCSCLCWLCRCPCCCWLCWSPRCFWLCWLRVCCCSWTCLLSTSKHDIRKYATPAMMATTNDIMILPHRTSHVSLCFVDFYCALLFQTNIFIF